VGAVKRLFIDMVSKAVSLIVGAGYHPFPAVFGRFDVRHSHFITIKAYKNEEYDKYKTR